MLTLSSSACDTIIVQKCKYTRVSNRLLTTAAVVRTHAVVYARVTVGICMYS